MAVIRVEKTRNYTVMSNHHFKEREMSLKAKGLLSLMLSLPDEWDYSIQGLVAICKENETCINSTLKELKQFGYLEVIKLMPNQTKSGRIEYEYIVHEYPKQEGKKQDLENLGVEIQGLENQVQLNTNKSNTDLLNTKDNNSPTRSIKHKHGEFKHVLLSDDDKDRLLKLFAEDPKIQDGYSFLNDCITTLDEFIELKGYKAKNHYLAIRKWVIKAVHERRGQYYQPKNKNDGSEFSIYDV